MACDPNRSSLSVNEFVASECNGRNSSELDSQGSLEIIFRSESDHRRKSSLVPTDDPRIGQRRAASHNKNTACFVHSLLSSDWITSLGPLESLNELPSRPVKEGAECLLTDNDNDKASVVDYGHRLPEYDVSPVMHSRHLTKWQLSDLAWNVRHLSKRLSSIKIKFTVKTVFLVTKVHDESLVTATRELTKWLLSKNRDDMYIVYVEKRLQDHPDFNGAKLVEEDPSVSERLEYWDSKVASERPHIFDFVITLGGDGTVLYTSWLFQRIVPPVLSFALGSLGFLTKFDFNNYQQILSGAFRNGVAVCLRLRFECTIMRSNPRAEKPGQDRPSPRRDLVEELVGDETGDTLTHRPDKMFEILNDVVVDRGPSPTMSTIELFGDNKHFTTVLADGICISTPTGSTAYNLAAGGSLSHPENPVILVTAICAHTLSFRPIILPDTVVLRMGVPYDARTTSWASFDGREKVELQPGDYVTVSASRYPFAYVMPPEGEGEDWVHRISKTLNWNSRQKQKAFK